MRTQNNKLSFKGENIFVGLDVHKKNWAVCLHSQEFELKTFTQPPSVEALVNYLKKNYPDALYHCVYESGYSGYWIQRELSQNEINCIVVNAADVPTKDKEKKQKRDKIDCRKLARSLKNNELDAIYIMSKEGTEDRALVRTRDQFVKDQTRIKNRIKSLLAFHGISVPEEYDKSSSWSKHFIVWLQSLELGKTLKLSLSALIDEYLSVRKLLLQITKEIRTLSKSEQYAKKTKLIFSIPGIGLINGMIFITELEDIKRFKNLDDLSAYVGLIPEVYSSSDTENIKEMTNRGNAYIREALVESSWMIIRKDPALTIAFKNYCKRMHPNLAIIKIAKRLLNRIRYVLLNEKEYVIGVVE